jgi:peptidoglycan/xylan/chitin deacetylase (PgdA/CDA1 family)
VASSLRRLATLHRAIPGVAPATVSLTFDDALGSQRTAADLLAAHNLRGTFFIPSGLVGNDHYMSWNELHVLAEGGHEIGGHSTNHRRIVDIPLEQARHEITDDRHTLIERGFDPVSFAYPFGRHNAQVEALVRDAGYEAARGTRGYFETLPPANRFGLRAPHSAHSWTTAEHLAGLVLAAEDQLSWIILSFHHILDDPRLSYTTAPTDLAIFLEWLIARGANVLPVREVLSEQSAERATPMSRAIRA